MLHGKGLMFPGGHFQQNSFQIRIAMVAARVQYTPLPKDSSILL